MKALFSYNPQQDNLLPCKEAGLQFNERDILVVFDQDDPEWWQANKIDERIPKVGLIPSSKLRERYAGFTDHTHIDIKGVAK